MAIIDIKHMAKPKLFMWKEKKRHWSDGRIVLIMPDVPGKHFNAEDTIFLRTPEEHEIGRAAIGEVRANMLRHGRPSWYNPKSAPAQDQGTSRDGN